MAGSVESLELNLAELKGLSVLQDFVQVGSLGIGAHDDLGSGGLGQTYVAGNEVGMKVCEENIFDCGAALLGQCAEIM